LKPCKPDDLPLLLIDIGDREFKVPLLKLFSETTLSSVIVHHVDVSDTCHRHVAHDDEDVVGSLSSIHHIRELTKNIDKQLHVGE
jgi:hypothetical protein